MIGRGRDGERSERAALAEYFEAAASWDRDRELEQRRSARRAWRIAGVAAGLAALAVTAVAALVPLQRVQPYVIRVDNATGIVDVVPEGTRGEAPSQLVTRYVLNGFVAARERFVPALAEADYLQVGAYQSPGLNQAWHTAWDRANPDSPLNRYRDGTTVRVQVKAISFLTRAGGIHDTAQVRFFTATRMGGVGGERIEHWIATIQYTWRAPSPDAGQRNLNPLGFRVLEYRREPEVLPLEPPAARPVVAQRPVAGDVS